MTQLEIFKRLMEKAEKNGYTPPRDWQYQIGRITDGTNYYAIIFDEKGIVKEIQGE